MAFTGNTLSTTPVPSPLQLPKEGSSLEWSSWGALGIQDPTNGLEFQIWDGVASRNERNNTKVKLTPRKEGEQVEVILPEFPLSHFTFSFDQNMFPAIAYTACDVSRFYWWDNTVNEYKLETLPEGTITPSVMLDDKRQFNIGGSDVILAYIKDNTDGTSDLCFKRQRDRYGTEYTLQADVGPKKIVSIGMNDVYRFQFELEDREEYAGKQPTCKESSR